MKKRVRITLTDGSVVQKIIQDNELTALTATLENRKFIEVDTVKGRFLINTDSIFSLTIEDMGE